MVRKLLAVRSCRIAIPGRPGGIVLGNLAVPNVGRSASDQNVTAWYVLCSAPAVNSDALEHT